MSELDVTLRDNVYTVCEPVPLKWSYEVEEYPKESGLFPMNEILVTSYILIKWPVNPEAFIFSH